MTSGTTEQLSKEQKIAGLYHYLRQSSEKLAKAKGLYDADLRKVGDRMQKHGITMQELTEYTLAQEPAPQV